MLSRYRYDVALSFAGEQREFVENVFKNLKERGLKVFYDEDPSVQAQHIGERFSIVSQIIYGSGADNVIMFISKEYVTKPWTVLESTHIADRLRDALFGRGSGVYLAEFDRTPLPGVASEIWRKKIEKMSPSTFCDHYIDWRANRTKLDHSDIILMLSQAKFSEVIDLLSKVDNEQANHNDIVFSLYNITCARSKYARRNTEEHDRLLDDAVNSLHKCIQVVENSRPEYVQELIDFADIDDDLIYLRKCRKDSLRKILRRKKLNTIYSGVNYSKESGCVDANSIISTPNGQKRICELKKGDQVFSFSPLMRERRVSKIISTKVFPLKQRIFINNILIASMEQTLYCEQRGWVASDVLKIGDFIMKDGGVFERIHSLSALNKADVMIVGVEDSSHTFISDGFVCHNMEK
ncbi:MAG: hypothetical protein JWR10_906 [Rubritepida sp.]|nr:hypothetical protein [Rubritepida sp.]